MKSNSRRSFIKSIGTTAALVPFIGTALAGDHDELESLKKGRAATCDYRLLRHAAAIFNYNGKKILIDPMINNAVAVPMPVDNTELREILESLDAILLTHAHSDHFNIDQWHFDIIKDLPIFCQSTADGNYLRGLGFTDVREIGLEMTYEEITIHKTGGQHGVGTGWDVSGFVFKADGNKSVYIAGDTTYVDEVSDALETHKPDITIVNSGAVGPSNNPWTMTAEHVGQVAEKLPSTQIIAVHLEVHPNAQVTRAELRTYTEEKNIAEQVLIPADGESINLCDSTSIDNLRMREDAVKAGPNPFNDHLTLTIPGQLQHVRVLNVNGQLVNTLYKPYWDGNLSSGQPAPKGMYVLLISTDERILTKRVIKK